MSYDVTLQRCGLNALFDLKGDAAAVQSWAGEALPALPDQPNHRTRKEDSDLYYIGRDHWLMRAPLEQEEALEARLKPTDCPADISIVRISDTTPFFRLTGPDAAQIMSIACPLDLHESVFGPDAVTNTEIFGLKGMVMWYQDGFEFAVEQSFGDMVDEYLARATA